MKYKLVIADVDGTIIPPSEYPAPKSSGRLTEAVDKANKAGVVFSIATARSLDWVKEIIGGLKLNSLVILDNGARIYDCSKKNYIWESFIMKKDVYAVISILKKDRKLRIFYTNGNGEKFTDLRMIDNHKVSKILVLGITPQKAEELYQRIKKIPTIEVNKTISGTTGENESVHVTNKIAAKDKSLRRLAKFLDIHLQEIIGIGDSYNDFSFLKICGLKVAMGNATSDIKAIADYIAPSYHEDGVAQVLEKFIL